LTPPPATGLTPPSGNFTPPPPPPGSGSAGQGGTSGGQQGGQTSNDGGTPTAGGGLSVTLDAHDFGGSPDRPWTQVTLAGPSASSASSTANVDVDLNHDGTFSPSELNYTHVPVGSGTLPLLSEGTYNIRVHVNASDGASATSNVVVVQFDPHAGILRS